MSKTNFSAAESMAFDMAHDLSLVNFSGSDGLSTFELQNALRDKINDEITHGMTMYQAWRRNKDAIFEIVEDVVTTSIGENIMNSPFIERFVEVKNRALGDDTEFYSEGSSFLTVATFAGNHWDTNRQMVDLGSSFKLPSEWMFIHVYEDFERWLLGVIPFEKVIDKVYKSMNKYMTDRIYTQFQSVSDAVANEFTASGNSLDELARLCDFVATANGSDVTIAGTKPALRKVANLVPDKLFADSQKEARANTGTIGSWEGIDLMVIPQTFKSGTMEFALNDKDVFIIAGDSKPIKLEIIGDTRTTEDMSGKRNDGSVDLQVQTKFGLGLLLPERGFGKFTFNG